MFHHRLIRLRMPQLAAYLLSGACLLGALTGAAPMQNAAGGGSQTQAQPSRQTAPQQQNQPQSQNPFENVPAAPEKAPAPKAAATVAANVIEGIEFRGQRRTPQDMMRALIYSRVGDVYDPDTVHRDFMALWNTNRFDDLRIETERGPKGGIILIFQVTERRMIHTIDYTGNKSITKSEILDRFKDRKVALSPESQYDPAKIQYAKNVLQDFEAERGHQYATVTPQIRQVPPGGVDVTFVIDEGPKVKVGHIFPEGNHAFTRRDIIRAMKNTRPIGIPHSLLFEDLFARTYDSTKLDEDFERIRQAYQSKGYFEAHVIDHNERIYDVYGRGLRIPLINPKRPGKRVDITVVVSEGDKYYLRNFNFVGMKLFKTPDLIERQVFHMAPGDVFSTEKLQKGIDEMKKLYGNFGYIDFVPSPDPEPVPGKDQIDLTLDIDEGHQFFVRRIDFQGNTTTRDRVIRRELLINEGDLFSQQLWDTSILRLNQLGYFDPLKPEDATDIKRDTKTNTVDLLLKLHERGKNSIQLNGGISGIFGSFIGFSYSTNNFLGLGETLSLGAQIGTLMSNVTFGFTEPYLFDHPIQTGFTVFYQRYSFNEGQQESEIYGANLIPYFNSLGTENLLNYVSNGYGFTTFASYQLKRSFARVGLTYGYSIQKLQPLTSAATQYFDYLDFEGVGGPTSLATSSNCQTATAGPTPIACNPLNGIRASTITPMYSYNTVNHPIIPTHGLRMNLSFGFTGSVLGGNVNYLQPALDIAYFRRGIFKSNVMGFHVNSRLITGFGGKVAPPYSRYYIGGEDDVRGFYIMTVSPFAYIPTSESVPLYNSDGTQRVTRSVDPSTGAVTETPITTTVPAYQLVMPGGDMATVFNYEYRIPIFGPVTLAPFIDVGIDRIIFPNQLGLNPDRVAQLNSIFPQYDFNPRAVIAPGTEKPRISTGLELQVLMPVVNAPFRLYWAYNLSYVNTTLTAPVVVGPSYFPNNYSYQQALQTLGSSIPFDERHSMFQFTVGRVF
jgi:outer membrane protein insertion porin family